jgi:6,7-dimethyl-8-ribityllumazine synthase
VSEYRTIEGNLNAAGHRYALVVARFNHFIVDHLVSGAIDTLIRHGCDRDAITVYRVPGGFELPIAAQRIAHGGQVDAIIALGAVIRGATPHFDFIASEATKGLASVSLEANIPIANGVLTCNTIEQAIERAGTKAGNKGAEAAITAIEMVDLLRRISTEGAA